MKTLFRINVKLVFFLIILPAICYQINNQFQNQHIHIYNGKVVMHAHPYLPFEDDQAPDQKHHHDNGDLFLLDQYSQITFIPLLYGFSLNNVTGIDKEISFFYGPQIKSLNLFLSLSLRAPPSL